MRGVYTLSVFLVLLFVGCKKPKGDDISGDVEVKGTVYLNDTLRGLSEEVIQPNLSIQLKRKGEEKSQNFLYSTSTDQLGNFTFTNLHRDSTYYLVAQKEVNGILFSSQTPVTKDSIRPIRVVLYPNATMYNILSIQVKDSISFEPLSGVKVCLFNNSILARNNQCDGSIYFANSNKFGRLVTSKLDTGWHYINAQIISGNVTLRARDSFKVTSSTGLILKNVFLK